ncbi:carbonic anhydrase 3 [Bemisia tabaci]|uniref:carbonic anhydrase 3 n=1 Tax=Bemisia tabaci TaxID=7038 RepID=UPI0008F9BD7F|nr:PREDICTED: carbonic anhydrase 3-like [Bemisia tabaci]UCR17212.1 carbonic anhydrase 3 [Bemisia tabaci]
MELAVVRIIFLVCAFHTIADAFRILRPGPLRIYNNTDEELKSRWPWVKQKFHKKMQSPVDINTDQCTFVRLPPIYFIQYWEAEGDMAILENTGHTVKLKLQPKTPIRKRPMISGGPAQGIYVFDSMHMHWGETDNNGSEHLLDGQPFSCEMHIVHYNLKYKTLENALNYFDGLLVTGFFGDAVELDNPELQEFIDDLKQIHDCNKSITVPIKPIFTFIRDCVTDQNYYCYPGSLTTPDFQECAIWIVFSKPFEISSSQLEEFRELKSSEGGKLINKNDRELQDFNDRPILFSVGEIKSIE